MTREWQSVLRDHARFIVTWIVASAMGGAATIAAALFALDTLSARSLGQAVVGFLMAGALFGIPQALTLQRHVPHPGRWIPITAAGLILTWGTGILVSLDISGKGDLRPALVVVGGGVGGLCVGALQILILDRYIRSIPAWLIASCVGGVFFGPATLIASLDLWQAGRVVQLLVGALCGAGYGTVTGIALSRLLQDRPGPSLLDRIS
jgi:hypothetical protein